MSTNIPEPWLSFLTEIDESLAYETYRVNVNPVGIATLPKNYEDRLTEVIAGTLSDGNLDGKYGRF